MPPKRFLPPLTPLMSKAHFNFASNSKIFTNLTPGISCTTFPALQRAASPASLMSSVFWQFFHLPFSRTSNKYFSLKYLTIEMVQRINKQGNGVHWNWNQAILICCLIPPTTSKRDPEHWTSEVTLVMSTRFLVEVKSNHIHALRAQDLCLLWLSVVSLLWPKMREECGDGPCCSSAEQSHKAGLKARADPGGLLVLFPLVLFHLPNNTQDSEATTRTASAEAESSLVMCSGNKWRNAKKILVPDEVHFQTAASQEDFYRTKGWPGKKKNSSGQFWLFCI